MPGWWQGAGTGPIAWSAPTTVDLSVSASLGCPAVHELAHQWLGNAVSPERWSDLWLNEGWATYATWLRTEHRGGTTARAAFDSWYAPARNAAYWSLPVDDPGPLGLFATQVYNRGAGTLLRIHPETGRKGLFVNPGFTSHVVGVSEAESRHILDLLYAHITKPEHIVRHRWQPGDVGIWDNRSTLYYANRDYSQTRVMRRITLAGDVPFGPAS
jgi:hypothetical protein